MIQVSVIASEAKQSMYRRTRKDGLLRRFAPVRKRFAFVAGNDGVVRYFPAEYSRHPFARSEQAGHSPQP